MAKLTLSGLQSFVVAYVDASKQAGTWSGSTDNTLDLLDKVGKIVTLDGDFNDPLTELNGDELPLGKTIEEYFIDLTLPTAFDSTGANALAPADPTVESVTYSYTLGRKKVKTTRRFDDIERASLTSNDASNMIAKIMERLYNSQTVYEYAIKKQLLGNVIAKAISASNSANLIVTIAKPTDTTTGEAFIKQVKKDIEKAQFVNEGNNLGDYLIGKSPSLNLYIGLGIVPDLEVDTLAGAFNAEKLAIPAQMKVIDDFGTIDVSGTDYTDKFYALLIDPRGVKLHNGYRAVRSQENADGDFINFYYHTEFTAYISKSVFLRAYRVS